MKIITDIDQRSDEWRKIRCGVLTASTFNVVLMSRGGKPSLTRRNLIYQKATERITQMPCDDDFQSYYMQRGNDLETEAHALYNFTSGLTIDAVSFVYDDDERIGCSPDGLVENDGGVEFKYPKLSTHVGYILGREMPKEYVAQVQGLMMVAQREWVDFCSYCPQSNVELWRKREYRNELYIARLRKACNSFLDEVEEIENKLRASE